MTQNLVFWQRASFDPARIFHELPAAAADMSVLPSVLGCRTLRRTVQVRLGSNLLRLPGTRRKRLRCAWHTLLHGLVTAIRETSGLGVIKDVRTDRAKVGTFFAMKVGRRSKGEGCPRQRAQRDLHRRSFQFTKAGANQDESTF